MQLTHHTRLYCFSHSASGWIVTECTPPLVRHAATQLCTPYPPDPLRPDPRVPHSSRHREARHDGGLRAVRRPYRLAIGAAAAVRPGPTLCGAPDCTRPGIGEGGGRGERQRGGGEGQQLLSDQGPHFAERLTALDSASVSARLRGGGRGKGRPLSPGLNTLGMLYDVRSTRIYLRVSARIYLGGSTRILSC